MHNPLSKWSNQWLTATETKKATKPSATALTSSFNNVYAKTVEGGSGKHSVTYITNTPFKHKKDHRQKQRRPHLQKDANKTSEQTDGFSFAGWFSKYPCN